MLNKTIVAPVFVLGLFALLLAHKSVNKLDELDTKKTKQIIPADFAVSDRFDGIWKGTRINDSNNPTCQETVISGYIKNGKISLTLVYNGAPIKGWISDTGEMILESHHHRWDYQFASQITGDTLTGEWEVTNGPCFGTWEMERQIS